MCPYYISTYFITLLLKYYTRLVCTVLFINLNIECPVQTIGFIWFPGVDNNCNCWFCVINGGSNSYHLHATYFQVSTFVRVTWQYVVYGSELFLSILVDFAMC